ncbi:MAG TPA: hypothetical protein VGC41_09580 [Kofleriaceae bacterium]
MAKKPIPKRAKGVPAAAVYSPELEEWELGKRDRAGHRIGAWKFWWPATGHLCAETFFEDNEKKETLKRFHPDGTISHEGVTYKGFPMPGTVYVLQRSKKPTTELALQIPEYKNVFRMEQYVIRKGVSKWKNFDAKGRRIELDGTLMFTLDVKKYAKNFAPFAVPKTLAKLVAFQNDVGAETFAQGFMLDVDDKGLVKIWSRAKPFLSALFPIAAATGTGTWYFAWNPGKAKSIDAMPIVVFGDEGGEHVVAQNLNELLQLVAVDAEPMVDHDEVSYFKNKDEGSSDDIDAYRKWLKTELGLGVGNPKAIMKKAQAQYQAAFQAWVKSFSAER